MSVLDRNSEPKLPADSSTLEQVSAATVRMAAEDPQRRVFQELVQFARDCKAAGSTFELGESETIPADGPPLVREGDAYDGVYLVLQGSVQIDRRLNVEDEQPEGLARTAPILIGEIAAITGKRSATVRPGPEGVTVVRVGAEAYQRFLKDRMIPELRHTYFDRVPDVRTNLATTRTRMEGVIGKAYPAGLEPVDGKLEAKNALLFLALRDRIAPLYTQEALDEAQAELPESSSEDFDPRFGYEARLLVQIAVPDTVEANHDRWHEYGVWEHTRQVGNAIQFLEQLDPGNVARPYLQELKNEMIDGMSKYDLLLLSLTLHDLGKAKPKLARAKNGEVYPSHEDHEKRSEQLILRALQNGAKGNEADQRLSSLLQQDLGLTPEQIKYIGRLAALHFEFGKVRRTAGRNFSMAFMQGPEFAAACDEILADPERQPYQREIGLMFLLDTAGKTPKDSWQVEGVAPGGLPTDEQIAAMRPVWEQQTTQKYRPGLVDAYTSFQTSRATALQYLANLRQKTGGCVPSKTTLLA